LTARHRRRTPGRSAACAVALAALLAFGPPAAGRVAAQPATYAERCPEPSDAFGGGGYCQRVAHAIGILQPRIAIAAAAGNPVPGTASTLGTRLGTLPRLSVAGRVGGVTARVPSVGTSSDLSARSHNVMAVGVDGALGVYSGMPLLPTVGGFGSIDALASVGLVLPGGGALARGNAFTWGAGARVGIVRESFTMPGVSLSGMYRRIGAVEYGDPSFARHDTRFEIDGTRVLSVRAAVDKRLLALNVTAGVGWDRTTSDASLVIRVPPEPARPPVTFDGLRAERAHAFVNVGWTTYVLNFVGELGVHAGGDAGPASETVRAAARHRGTYGSVAARLAI
jgi:hypothetical protein